MLGGLHALGMLALGFLFVGIAADCTDKLKGNSCTHLDGRRQLGPEPTHGVATTLATLVRHAPLLLATATGGASLALPSASLGAALAKSADSAPALAPIGPIGSARRLTVGLVSGCGDRIGDVYLLASKGVRDCTGCGSSLTSVDACMDASKKLAGKKPKELSWGPNGCSVSAETFMYNPRKECFPSFELGKSTEHSPVCKCDWNEGKTAPRLPCRKWAPNKVTARGCASWSPLRASVGCLAPRHRRPRCVSKLRTLPSAACQLAPPRRA